MRPWWCAPWLHGRPAGPQPDRPGPVTGRIGRRDCRTPPPTPGIAPAGGPAPLHAGRPDDSRRVGEAAAPRSLADLPCHPIDSAAMAQPADPPTVELSRPRSKPPGLGPRGDRPGAPPGPGESPLGIPARCRRVPQARRVGVGYLGTDQFCAATISDRHPAATAQPGRSSCAPRPPVRPRRCRNGGTDSCRRIARTPAEGLTCAGWPVEVEGPCPSRARTLCAQSGGRHKTIRGRCGRAPSRPLGAPHRSAPAQ